MKASSGGRVVFGQRPALIEIWQKPIEILSRIDVCVRQWNVMCKVLRDFSLAFSVYNLIRAPRSAGIVREDNGLES